jgi:hypothetical protein
LKNGADDRQLLGGAGQFTKELFTYSCEDWLQKVRCIVIELHDAYRPGCATAFFKAISSREFSMFCKGEDIVITFNDIKQGNSPYA